MDKNVSNEMEYVSEIFLDHMPSEQEEVKVLSMRDEILMNKSSDFLLDMSTLDEQ